jgi:hypothetical protein
MYGTVCSECAKFKLIKMSKRSDPLSGPYSAKWCRTGRIWIRNTDKKTKNVPGHKKYRKTGEQNSRPKLCQEGTKGL